MKECFTAGFLGTVLALLSYSALAADPSAKGPLEEELRFMKEETVSIAARHEQPISQAPSDVYVITDEDIRQSGATDIPTLLRRIPGVEVVEMSGAVFNVSVRGDNQASANKLLVLVDGRSIYEDLQGTVFWKGIPITLPEIKRIEVLKGPASALYGFNAFDGVVNIITKSPEEIKGTTLQFGGGEFGTISASAIEAGTAGSLGYRLSAGHDQNNQWRDRNALAFRANKLNAEVDYHLSPESKLLLSGGIVDMNRFDNVSELGVSSLRPTQSYANAQYERQNFFVRTWWKGYSAEDDLKTNPILANILSFKSKDGSSPGLFSENSYDVEAQQAFDLAFSNRLALGLNYRHNSLSSNFTDSDSQENRLGFYFQDEWKATRRLTAVAGLRYDLHTEINPTVSPRLALLFAPIENHTFRASVSVAYRPPTLLETHLQNLTIVNLPFPPPVTIFGQASPNLKPEKIVSYELGYQGWFLKHRLRVRTDIFYNQITNLVNDIGTSPTTAGFVNDPGRAEIYGGEAGIETLLTSWLSVFANFSYEEISQTFTDTAQRAAPRFKANAGVRTEWENGLNGEATLNHVGSATYPIAGSFARFAPLLPAGVTIPDTHLGSYNLLNLRAGYRFWREKAEVAVSVFNALNDQHKEHPLGDTIGSQVMGWLTLRF